MFGEINLYVWIFKIDVMIFQVDDIYCCIFISFRSIKIGSSQSTQAELEMAEKICRRHYFISQSCGIF